MLHTEASARGMHSSVIYVANFSVTPSIHKVHATLIHLCKICTHHNTYSTSGHITFTTELMLKEYLVFPSKISKM